MKARFKCRLRVHGTSTFIDCVIRKGMDSRVMVIELGKRHEDYKQLGPFLQEIWKAERRDRPAKLAILANKTLGRIGTFDAMLHQVRAEMVVLFLASPIKWEGGN